MFGEGFGKLSTEAVQFTTRAQGDTLQADQYVLAGVNYLCPTTRFSFMQLEMFRDAVPARIEPTALSFRQASHYNAFDRV
jgi:hypothetical protein